MNIKKILGTIGAAAAAFGGLVLAGKSGFGENLFAKKDTGEDEFDDADAVLAAADDEEEVMVEDLSDEEES